MPPLRSRTVTHGRNMAGARALLRATGVAREDLGKPIVAVANSFTEFVPGHVHLREVGQVVADAVRAAGAIPREFSTIAVDDGIAMGHGGMLYSLPSRELIADSVEYMVNAHCADALVCISNCDKITPGMLMAALRLNIPAVFVSGGPMEAGLPRPGGETTGSPTKIDLIDSMIASADPGVSDERLAELDIDARIDHRSLEAQGIALEPQSQIGAPAQRIEGEGIEAADRAEWHARVEPFGHHGLRVLA